MDKIQLDIYTERLLQRRTKELLKVVPLELFICIEQIINEAISQHYIYRYKLEELMSLLQEVESKNKLEKLDIDIDEGNKRIKNSSQSRSYHNEKTFYNQMHDYKVVRYRKLIMLMLIGKNDLDEKKNINGITF